MNCFNEILQNHQHVKYVDKWGIANFLKQAAKNEENSIIRKQHIDNIQKLKTSN